MKSKIATLVALLTFFPLLSNAALNQSDQDAIRAFAKAYSTHKTADALLAAVKESFSPEELRWMAAEAKPFAKQPLPKMEVRDGDTLVFESGKKMNSLQVISGSKQLFSINHRTVDLSKAKNIAERMQRVMAALPMEDQAQLMRFLLMPETAYADDLRVAGGAGAFVAGSVLAVESTNPLGWAMLAAAVVVWESGTCSSISKDANTCQQKRAELEEALEANPDRKLAYERKQTRPACPAGSDASVMDPKDRKEAAAYANELIHASSEQTRILVPSVVCRSKTTLAECAQDVSTLAFFLCVDTFGLTDEYVYPWATGKSGHAPVQQSPRARPHPSPDLQGSPGEK